MPENRRHRFPLRLGAAAVAALAAAGTLSGQTAGTDRKLPVFDNVAARAGIQFHLDAGGGAQNLILESNSAGVVVIDYDNDGWQDLYFVNGSTVERLEAGERSRGNRLYRNNRDGTFTDVTAAARVGGNGAWGMGGCVGDVDNNGFDDLFVTSFGRNVLYLNNGNGTFRDESVAAGIEGGDRWHAGCAFGDYDGDGDLDLYVSNYVRFTVAEGRRITAAELRTSGANPRRYLVGPRSYTPTPHQFYENTGRGRFVDVSRKSGVAAAAGGAGGNGFGVVWGDYDNDGDADVFVGNDQSGNFLFRNNGNRTFTEVATQAAVAVDYDGNALASMGVDMADYNNDGLLDIVVTTYAEQHPELFRNNGNGTFTDVARSAGLPPSLFMGWGAQFADFDLDGRLDLVIANGHVIPAMDDTSSRLLMVGYRQRPTIFQQRPGATFQEQGLRLGGPFAEGHVSRGLALADVNNDGQPDIVIANQDEAPSVLLSRGVPGNWSLLKLRGTRSNRSAIGARVTVRAGGRTQIREVKSGGSYLSQSDLRVHLGLGESRAIDELVVRWPSGRIQTERNVPANRIVEIIER